MNDSERYSRQIKLKEVGLHGQRKIKEASVLIVGCGGLGCPLALYLASAGVGRIGLIDADKVEMHNLHRQVLFTEADIGRPKVEVAAEKLLAHNSALKLDTVNARFSVNNALGLSEDYSLIVDATDNFTTKYLINDVCLKLSKPFVAASIFGFEGQVGVFNVALEDGERSPTYRCLFPEPPDAKDVPDCNENGVLGVLPGLLGLFQAQEVLKLILGVGDLLVGKVLLYNALSLKQRIFSFSRNEELCSKVINEPLKELKINCSFDQSNPQSLNNGANMVKEISVKELKVKLDAKENFQLIDVREAYEKEIADIGGELIPLAEIAQAVDRISKDKPVVIYCRSGGRSMRACQVLAAQHGFTNLINLTGGVLAWADQVDSTMKKY